MLTDRSSLVTGALALALVAGCGEAVPGSNDEGASPGAPEAASPSHSVETLTYEAPLGDTTWIFAHVEGRAVCVVHDVGASASDAAPIYADTAGWIRVGIEPSPTASVAPVALDCTGPDGRVVERTLAIRSNPRGRGPRKQPEPSAGRPPDNPRARRQSAGAQPEGARGPRLPAPPRPRAGPGAVRRVVRVVSTPSRVPLEEHVRAPARSRRLTGGSGAEAGGTSWYNTSGAIAGGVGGTATYAQVGATWSVPQIYADPANAFPLYESCEWAGLCSKALGLIQAGTWDTYTPMSNGPAVITHSGWYESTANPGNGGAMFLPTSQFPVSHADTIYSETYICAPQRIEFDGQWTTIYMPNADGAFGCMYVNDQTQGWDTLGALPIGGPVTWVNTIAEWVLERPSVSAPDGYGLSNYGTVQFSGLSAGPGPWANAPLATMFNQAGQRCRCRPGSRTATCC